MSYRQIKCWWCGQIPHPLDYDHVLWCFASRNMIHAAPHHSAESAGGGA